MKDPKWILPVVAAFLVLSSLAHGILGWKAMSAELFGLLAFLFRSFSTHFRIAFVIPGALLGVGVLKCRWATPR